MFNRTNTAGTDKAALKATIRNTGRKNAPEPKTEPERRVTCRICNGAGRVGSEYLSKQTGQLTRQMCDPCNGAGQVTA